MQADGIFSNDNQREQHRRIFNNYTRPNGTGRSGKLEGPVHERLSTYFDRSAFTQPLPFTFGNLASRLSDIRSDGVRNFDLSLFKDFAILEHMKLQFGGSSSTRSTRRASAARTPA